MKNECVFCNIAGGKEPAFIIQESKSAMAILPEQMEVAGHTLVISKRHFQDIFDITADILRQVMDLARQVSLKIRKNLGADGINILHASGKDAQQSVFHFHIHIIPRFINDNINAWPDLPGCRLSHPDVLKLIKG